MDLCRFGEFHEYNPTPDDDPRLLAAGLGLRDFTELDVSPDDLVLACDERTLSTVASEAMASLLGEMTSGVPRTMFLSEGTDGVWAVQSDGRELLTAANLRAVQEHGLVRAPSCVTDGRVLAWRRPPIFSG